MSVAMIADCLAGKLPSDTSVSVQGWVRTRRDSKAGISFINIHDGSCYHPIQAVVANNIANYHSEILKLTAGCAIKVSGKLVESPGKGQRFEIQAEQVEVIGWVENPDTYPISPKHHSLEYLREYAHLRPRTNVIGAVTRLRHHLAQAIHQFFHQQGFFWVNTPLITANDCEGAGELFRVSTLDLLNLPRQDNGNINFNEDFFGRETFLTVSGQLNVECYCLALSKVYTFGPTFRAENSNTSRHLAEFWMVEPEMAFADLTTIIQLAETMLKSVFTTILKERADDMAFFAERIDKTCIQRLENIIAADFVHMEYSDAIKELEKSAKKFEFPVRWGVDLHTEHERFLCEELIGGPLVVKNYPKDVKAFYMRNNADGKTVAAMDVLVPGIGEIIGGSQREERLTALDERIAAMGLNKDAFWWYRELRKYGTVPHAGFGLGFERLLSYISGMSNIRDVIPFPRTPGNAEF